MAISLSREHLNLNYNKLLIKEGFDASEINQINNNIELINSSIFNIGNSILDIAKSLSEIKKFFKNNKWIDITDSGIFNLSGRTCRDFASAYDSWLFQSKIPDNILAELSARSLAKIGNFDLIKRNQIINRLLNGEIFTESDLTKFSSEKQIDNFDYNRQVTKAMDICHSLTNAEKLRHFENIMIINIKQKEEIVNLKKTISELKKK
tara:strand:+ start:196 stop:816 length:621 start_codon:yes stop_codon:yes gene_type:complete